MNVVVVDSGVLGDADFPMLDLNKFGWEQYVKLEGEDVEERCWRADIIVSVSTPINQAIIDKAFKLKLIVAAGDSVNHIDLAAARAREITVCNLPGLRADNASDGQQICDQVVDTINAYLKSTPINAI